MTQGGDGFTTDPIPRASVGPWWGPGELGWTPEWDGGSMRACAPVDLPSESEGRFLDL